MKVAIRCRSIPSPKQHQTTVFVGSWISWILRQTFNDSLAVLPNSKDTSDVFLAVDACENHMKCYWHRHDIGHRHDISLTSNMACKQHAVASCWTDQRSAGPRDIHTSKTGQVPVLSHKKIFFAILCALKLAGVDFRLSIICSMHGYVYGQGLQIKIWRHRAELQCNKINHHTWL